MGPASTTDRLSLTIDMHKMQPVDCSQSLADLLGYSSKSACLAATRQSPFQGFNLLQATGWLRDPAKKRLPVIDAKGAVVAETRRMTILMAGDRCIIEMQPATVSGSSQDIVLAAAGLRIDKNRRRLVLDGDTGHRLAGKLGLTENLTSLLTCIIEGDRDRLDAVLRQPGIAGWQEFYFRVADLHGVILEARYRFRFDGSELSGTITLLEPLSLRRYSLHSLPLLAGVDVHGGGTVLLPAAFQPEAFMLSLKEAVEKSWHNSFPVVSKRQVDGTCDCCRQMFSGDCLVVVLPGARPDLLEWQQMLETSPAQFNPAGLRLGRLARDAHNAGLHVSVALDEKGDVQLTLAGDPPDV